MRRSVPAISQIINDRPVTAKIDHEFIYTMKQGLLLALREQELINDLQLRIALERMDSIE